MMSNVLSISSPSSRLAIFLDSQAKDCLWLVPDSEVKNQIEDVCLEKFGYFDPQCVATKNDFWLTIFKHNFPDFYIVDSDFIKTFLKGFQLNQKEDSVFQLMNDFCSGFLNHYEDVVKDWFTDNQVNNPDLATDFLLAGKIFHSLIENKIIFKNWISEYLLCQLNLIEINSNLKSKSIFIDLGSALTELDLQLLQSLFFKSNLNFIKSEMPAADFMHATGYQCFEATSMSNEIRLALRLIRHQHLKGDKLHEIAIVTTNKKAYWPILLEMGRKEGIIFNESESQSLVEIPEVNRWLSYLKMQSKNYCYAELESLFDKELLSKKSFEKFEAENFNLLNDEYNIKFQNYTTDFSDSSSLISSFDFIKYILTTVNKFNLQENLEHLNKIFIDILSTPKIQFKFTQWLSYLFVKVINFKKMLTSEQAKGVSLLTVHSSSYWSGRCKIYLGLDTTFGLESLKEDFYLTSEQSNKAKIDLGFAKSRMNVIANLDEYDWSLKNDTGPVVYYTYSRMNSAGSAESPSRTWLELKLKENQKLSLTDLPVLRSDMIAFDLEKIKTDNTIILNDTFRKGYLTITAVEKHLKCPFVYAIEEELNFRHEISADLRLDARTVGTIKHEILEHVVNEKMWYHQTDLRLQEIVNDVFQKYRHSFFDQTSFQNELNKFIQWGSEFVFFEKQWRVQFFKTETLYTEKSFEIYHNDVQFKGKIDRIDISKTEKELKELVVIDYKNSGSYLSGIDSWIKNNQLQLLFYTWVVSKHLAKSDYQLKNTYISGAFYYLVNKFDRASYGLRYLQDESCLLDLTSLERNKVSKEKLNGLFEELEQILNTQIQKIKTGVFRAEPMDPKDCDSCNWRSTCRAKHLSI